MSYQASILSEAHNMEGCDIRSICGLISSLLVLSQPSPTRAITGRFVSLVAVPFVRVTSAIFLRCEDSGSEGAFGLRGAGLVLICGASGLKNQVGSNIEMEAIVRFSALKLADHLQKGPTDDTLCVCCRPFQSNNLYSITKDP